MPTAFDKKSNTDDRVTPWLCLPKNTMSALPTVSLTTYMYPNICTLLTIDPKPHCTPDTIYLPASQRTPPYPGGQAQTNLFTRSLHDPPFWHGLLAHSFISERQIQVKVKTRFTDTGLIRTPHYYGQFSLSLGKESPYVFSKFTDTPLIRILSMPPSMSVWTRFDCTRITVSSKNKDPKQTGLS